jgi:hypothetical protein
VPPGCRACRSSPKISVHELARRDGLGLGDATPPRGFPRVRPGRPTLADVGCVGGVLGQPSVTQGPFLAGASKDLFAAFGREHARPEAASEARPMATRTCRFRGLPSS